MDPSLPPNGNLRLKRSLRAGLATILAGTLIVSQAALAAYAAPSEKGKGKRAEQAAGAGETTGPERAAQQRQEAETKRSSTNAPSSSSDGTSDTAENPAKKNDNGSNTKNSAAPSGEGQQTGWEGPPGNNGTVKIDGVPFDDHPDNEPHPGCVFQVDFYNYDQGDLDATYSFALQPPSGTSHLMSGTTFIGEDPNGGGRDLDASVTIDLTEALIASGAEPHPQQGFHVKLTVNAEGSIGADVKHKVFWVECDIQPAPPQGGGTPPPPAGGGGEVPPPTTGGDTDVLGEQFERNDRGDSVEVMGAQIERSLATTGADVRAALLLGLLLLGSGAFLLKAGRQTA